MNYRVKLAIAVFCRYIGLINLLRWWMQCSGHYLIILNYRSATGKHLRAQMLYLRRHYRILPLEAALDELYTPDSERKRIRDRRTLMALTFDDGYDDNYTYAYALAKELQVPITIFLVPGYIDGTNTFWWEDRLMNHSRVDQVTFEGITYNLCQQQERSALTQILDDRYSNAASDAERRQLLDSLLRMMGMLGLMPGDRPVPLLTWAKVREMEECEWVSYGAHTVHHPNLDCLADAVKVQHEVGDCRTMLEQQLGHSVKTFAYHYGVIGRYGLEAVKQADYTWAVTVIPGFNTAQNNPHLLYRISMNCDVRVSLLAAEVASLWKFLSRVKKSIIKFKDKLP